MDHDDLVMTNLFLPTVDFEESIPSKAPYYQRGESRVDMAATQASNGLHPSNTSSVPQDNHNHSQVSKSL